MRIEIYGSSDDNLCCKGDFNDEFSAWDRPVFLHFANGTVIEAEYAPKDEPYMWRIRPVSIADGVEIERVDGQYAYEGKDDRLIVTGDDLKVLGCFGDVAGPTAGDMEYFMDKFDFGRVGRLSPGARLRLMKAMQEIADA